MVSETAAGIGRHHDGPPGYRHRGPDGGRVPAPPHSRVWGAHPAASDSRRTRRAHSRPRSRPGPRPSPTTYPRPRSGPLPRRPPRRGRWSRSRGRAPRRRCSTSPGPRQCPGAPRRRPPCDFECDVPEPQLTTPAASIANPKVKQSTLADLTVKDPPKTPAASRPIDPERPAKVVTPGELWCQDLERLRRWPATGPSGRPNSQAGARLLDWTADPEAGYSPLWRTVLQRSSRPPTPIDARTGRVRRRSTRRSRRLRAGPAGIADLHLSAAVHGFGDFDSLDAASCRAGQSLIV